jgi:hypothetical protein
MNDPNIMKPGRSRFCMTRISWMIMKVTIMAPAVTPYGNSLQTKNGQRSPRPVMKGK